MRVYLIGSGRQWQAIEALRERLDREPGIRCGSFTAWGDMNNAQSLMARHVDGWLNIAEIKRADVIVWVKPAGNASHFEAGFATGLGKQVICYFGMMTEDKALKILNSEEYALSGLAVHSERALLQVLQALREQVGG